MGENWNDVAEKYQGFIELLWSMLLARMNDTGKIKYDDGVHKGLMIVGMDYELYAVEKAVLLDEMRRWEEIHGIDLSRSTGFVTRSWVVA